MPNLHLAVLPLFVSGVFGGTPSFLLAPAAPPADTASEAADPDVPAALTFFQSEQEAVLEMVRKKVAEDKIQARVDKLLDYRWIAQQSLGGPKHYVDRCQPRCEEFETLLAKLIRQNYLRRIRQADEGNLAYLGQELRRNGAKAKVDTRVSYTSPQGVATSVKVSYVMHRHQAGWIVRNIITDGVSLAKTYRYEFNLLLREGGIDRLIQQLEQQLAELAQR